MNRCTTIVCLLLFVATAHGQRGSSWTTIRNDRAVEQVAKRDVTPLGSNGPTGGQASGQLTNEAGQVWQEYDIRSFTHRLRDQEKPEQDVIDWILRETGTDTWFGDPMSVLSANRDAVRVYHTPAVQDVVKDIVDRFLNTRSEANEVAVRLVTVESPEWRVNAISVLEPVQTQTPGVEAWLLSPENAALLLDELARRPDYREHNSPNLTIYNGQTHTIKSTRPRTFQAGPNQAGSRVTGFAPIGQVDEGFSLKISPLVSRDAKSIEAVVKCKVNQVERLTPLSISNVDQYGMYTRSQIQVPQISSWQIHERFRWPTNEVLLISRGRVAIPGPVAPRNGLRRIFENGAPRAEALLFLESRSEIRSSTERGPVMASRTDAANYRGRY